MKKITIEIDTEYIPAVSLLKLAGVVDSGGQASYEIEQGHVTMDGVVLQSELISFLAFREAMSTFSPAA